MFLTPLHQDIGKIGILVSLILQFHLRVVLIILWQTLPLDL